MMKRFALLLLLCTGAGQLNAETTFTPRVGANLGLYYSWGQGGHAYDVVMSGLSAGLVTVVDDLFFDLYSEVNTVGGAWRDYGISHGSRSEVAGTLGYRLYQTAYLIGGYRHGMYGDSPYDDSLATQHGPFLGLNVEGLRLGESERDILSYNFIYQASQFESDYPTSEGETVYIKFGYRRAGSRQSYSFAFKYFVEQDSAAYAINESMAVFSVSHSFSDD